MKPVRRWRHSNLYMNKYRTYHDRNHICMLSYTFQPLRWFQGCIYSKVEWIPLSAKSIISKSFNDTKFLSTKYGPRALFFWMLEGNICKIKASGVLNWTRKYAMKKRGTYNWCSVDYAVQDEMQQHNAQCGSPSLIKSKVGREGTYRSALKLIDTFAGFQKGKKDKSWRVRERLPSRIERQKEEGKARKGKKAPTVRIEIGKTCGAEGIGQITFFVSINILWSLKK